MKRILKWIGIVLGGLIGLALVAALALFFSAKSRLNKVYDVPVETVAIPSDADSLARGQRLANVYCSGCHGKDFSGTAFFADPALGSIPAPNLTPGEGGAGGEFSDEDWVRALRHGLSPESAPLVVMPSGSLYHLSDADLGAIIAAMNNLPPVDQAWDERQLTPLSHILMAVGALGNVLTAESIDHRGPRPVAPAAGVNVDYGEYLAVTFGCHDCHGEGLAGGKSADPAAPPAPDITPGGELRTWTQADFLTAVRTRVDEHMPWKDMNYMTDDELAAIWLYLSSLPGGQ